jgi:hypothetical protein
MKYALTPGLTFTGTVNPDFGQVEADPAVVNLTAFETFFAERRPFFVEGSGNFNFGMDCGDGGCTGLFYSRRIGRTPQGIDDLPSGDGTYTDAPGQTTILGAGKLTGRVGKYSIGVMQAFTQEQDARVLTGSLLTQQPVEPFTSYTVGRVRREFANQSSVGVMLTSTNRSRGSALTPLPDRAVTTGIDWDLRFKARYALVGYWVGSDLRGSAEAIDRVQENSRHYFQRPDLTSAALDVTRTSLTGDGGMVGVQQDRRRARPLQLQRVVQESRPRHQRRRLHAPRRSAQRQQRFQVRTTNRIPGSAAGASPSPSTHHGPPTAISCSRAAM